MKRIFTILLSVCFLSCSEVEYNFSDVIKNESDEYIIQLLKENRIRYISRRENLFLFVFGAREENLSAFVCPYYGYRFYYLEKSVIEKVKACGSDIETLMFLIKVCTDYHIKEVRVNFPQVKIYLYEKDSYKLSYIYQLKQVPNYVYEKGNSIEYLNKNWCVIKNKID